MKTWLLAATALVAVSGCKAKNEEPAPAASPAAQAEATPAAASAPVASPGTYHITEADGKVTKEIIMADGTFMDSVDSKQTDTGTWRVDGVKSCFTSKGKSETCYTTGMPAADGTFTVTGPDGKQAASVKKIA